MSIEAHVKWTDNAEQVHDVPVVIKLDLPLKFFMTLFCLKTGIPRDLVDFRIDDENLLGEDTVRKMRLEPGVQIDLVGPGLEAMYPDSAASDIIILGPDSAAPPRWGPSSWRRGGHLQGAALGEARLRF